MSTATLAADGKVLESRRCQITEVAAKDGTLSFTRLDQAGAWPIALVAKSALDLYPEILKLSQYLLKVEGLNGEASYAVRISSTPAGTVTGKELAAGWNLTTVFDGALAAHSLAVLNLIAKLQGPLNNAWRAASLAGDAEKLTAAQAAIDAVETEIQAACQPAALHFEIAPALVK